MVTPTDASGVASYMYLPPPEMADAFKVDLIEVDEPGS